MHNGKSPRARDLLRPGRSKERLSGHLLEASRASELKCCKKSRQATPEQLRPILQAILSTIFTNIVTHACLYKTLYTSKRGTASGNPLMTDKLMNDLAEKA